MYLTYAEYKAMGGMLEETTFNNLEFEASSYVDYVTFNRLKNEDTLPQSLKQCMYYLITFVGNKLGALGGNDSNSSGYTTTVASQSNDGVSVSYNVLSAKDVLDTNEKEITKTIQRYLQGVTNSLGQKVLYRGLYPNE